ncbi:hypothetical protein J6590_027624 [Homalodisca vitripennis]|nr:hypothetical protein J6590_027624 [Homalodisca vitripennis]
MNAFALYLRLKPAQTMFGLSTCCVAFTRFRDSRPVGRRRLETGRGRPECSVHVIMAATRLQYQHKYTDVGLDRRRWLEARPRSARVYGLLLCTDCVLMR